MSNIQKLYVKSGFYSIQQPPPEDVELGMAVLAQLAATMTPGVCSFKEWLAKYSETEEQQWPDQSVLPWPPNR